MLCWRRDWSLIYSKSNSGFSSQQPHINRSSKFVQRLPILPVWEVFGQTSNFAMHLSLSLKHDKTNINSNFIYWCMMMLTLCEDDYFTLSFGSFLCIFLSKLYFSIFFFSSSLSHSLFIKHPLMGHCLHYYTDSF